MQPPIPQAFALTAYGHALLKGLVPPAAVLFPEDPTYQPLISARFTRRRLPPEEFCIGAVAWLEGLKERGAVSMRLWCLDRQVALPEPLAQSWRRARSARCAVQVDFPRAVEYWLPKDEAPRLVECTAAVEGTGDPAGLPGLADARRALADGMEACEQYAARGGLESWRGHFAAARAVLDGGEAPPGGIALPPELLPAGCAAPEAERLLEAIARAWPRDGLGAWRSVAARDDAGGRAVDALLRGLAMAMMAAAAGVAPRGADAPPRAGAQRPVPSPSAR